MGTRWGLLQPCSIIGLWPSVLESGRSGRVEREHDFEFWLVACEESHSCTRARGRVTSGRVHCTSSHTSFGQPSGMQIHNASPLLDVIASAD